MRSYRLASGKLRSIVVVIVLWQSWLARSGVAETSPSIDELLDRMDSSLRAFESIEFELESNVWQLGGAYSKETWTHATTGRLLRVPGGWKYRYRNVGNRYHGKLIPFDSEAEILLDLKGNRFRAARTFVVDRQVEISQQDAFEDREIRDGSVAVYVSEPRTDEALLGYGEQNATRTLFGKLVYDDNKSVMSIVRSGNAALRPTMELVDGHKTYVIDCRSQLGRHSLWLDPTVGCLPRRLRCEKQGSDLFAGKRLASIPAHGDREHRRPNAKVASSIVEVSPISISEIDGRSVIDGMTITTTLKYEGGAAFREREEIVLRNIVSPANLGGLKLEMDIPDGTPVFNKESPGIDFAWRGGEVVKLVDDDAIARVDGVHFGSTGTEVRFWLVVANVVVIIALIVLVIYRRYLRTSVT